jgi:hypothetical protein
LKCSNWQHKDNKQVGSTQLYLTRRFSLTQVQ